MHKIDIFNLSIKRLFFYIFLMYVSTTILTPKIDFGFITTYPFEPFLLIISFFILFKNKICLITQFEKFYFYFIGISALTYFIGVFNTGLFDEKTPFLIIKYLSFGFIIPITYYYSKYITMKNLKFIVLIQNSFIFIAGMYVIYNLVFFPISIGDIIWVYSQEYRLIGFTGYGFGLDGLRQIGTTSVQTGIFVGLILLINLSVYIFTKDKLFLYLFVFAFVGELLTQSRSGLVVIFVGIIYIIFENIRNKFILSMVISITLILTSLIYYFDLLDVILSFGTFAKLVESEGISDGSAQLRLKYMIDAYIYIGQHPLALIVGTGYGEAFTYNLIGTPFLENLVFTALFQSGILSFLITIFIFYFMWYYAHRYSKYSRENFYVSLLYGIKIFTPGFFVANTVGGNSLQTDFIVPFLFFAISICIYKIKHMETNI